MRVGVAGAAGYVGGEAGPAGGWRPIRRSSPPRRRATARRARGSRSSAPPSQPPTPRLLRRPTMTRTPSRAARWSSWPCRTVAPRSSSPGSFETRGRVSTWRGLPAPRSSVLGALVRRGARSAQASGQRRLRARGAAPRCDQGSFGSWRSRAATRLRRSSRSAPCSTQAPSSAAVSSSTPSRGFRRGQDPERPAALLVAGRRHGCLRAPRPSPHGRDGAGAWGVDPLHAAPHPDRPRHAGHRVREARSWGARHRRGPRDPARCLRRGAVRRRDRRAALAQVRAGHQRRPCHRAGGSPDRLGPRAVRHRQPRQGGGGPGHPVREHLCGAAGDLGLALAGVWP